MPFYEYICPNCGRKFSKLRAISQRDEPIQCPSCDSTTSQRRISLPMAFTRSENGGMAMIGGSGSSCGSCVATSCTGCMTGR